MAYFLGKSGADAIFISLEHICRVLNAYEGKLLLAITAAEEGGVITAEQAEIARTFVAGVRVFCAIFKLIAGNSGL